MNKISAITIISLSFAITAFASATPTLSVTNLGNNNDVQINVVGGDPNAVIDLFYTSTTNSSQIKVLGNTDSNGNYSTSISTASYGIVSNSVVYVAVGGLNGTHSNQIMWPTLNGTTNNSLSLTQTSITLGNGQTTTITANNTNGGSLYVSTNSNPNIASVTVNSNQITIFGSGYGTATINICSTINSALCSSLNVTVQSTSSGALTFSQNNLTLSSGQSQSITISGGNNSYIVNTNSNPSLAQASITGNTINIYGYSNSGSTSINVCTTDMSHCGVIYVTVNGTNSGTGSLSVTFSQNNPTIYQNQTTNISIYGASGVYNISSNSNPSIVIANISGNNLSLTGISPGATSVNICSSNGTCSGLNVVVSGPNGSSSQLSLSQNNVSVIAGQSTSISITGSGTYFLASNSNSNISSVSINGSTVTITGITNGTNTANICQSSNSACAVLTITVSGYGSNGNLSNSYPATFLKADLTMLLGQTVTLISNNTGNSLSVSNNSNPNVATVTINGNSVVISAAGYGTDIATVCQIGTNSCGTYTVEVKNSNSVQIPTPVTTTTTEIKTLKFISQLHLGLRGDEVLELQNLLYKLGLLRATPNGTFGPATRLAVMSYQRKNGITVTGILGPLTRASLNNK